MEKFELLAKKIRQDVLKMIYETKSPHIGSSFSMVEILVALYFKFLNLEDNNFDRKDKFLLSKGHGCATFFAILAKKGILTEENFKSFALDGGYLGQHPNRDVAKGIEITSGSLGHGLSIGSGMALAEKYDGSDNKIFVYMGDGEINEGSVWEGALFSSHHKLDNLIAIVDRNRLQALGRESEILNMDPLADKWKSFGWEVREINGHNFNDIFNTFEDLPFQKGKPNCIIANTIKGKGVSFMEDNYLWHDKCPNEEEYKKALKELQ